VTENPNVGDTELWEFYNFTADAHPMHVHEVVFEVVDRQSLAVDVDEEGEAVRLGHRIRRWDGGWGGFSSPKLVTGALVGWLFVT
jgi:FtsP/CotA-like multicopper oxidase with cupredoxin domain